MTKRILSICLALVLLFGVLAGCSKNEAQTADDTKKTEQSDAEDKTSTQFAYQAQYYDLPEDIQWIGTSCVTGDTLYFTASIPDGGTETYTDENGEEYSYDTYSEVIFRFDLDTGECVQLDNYVAEPVVENPDMPDGVTMNPDGSMQTFNSSTSIQTMAAGADGTLWLFRQTSATRTTARRAIPSPSLSSLTRMGRCCAPSRPFPRRRRTIPKAGAIRTSTPFSPTTRAMSIPMIIRPSTSTARTAASCSASPATS